MEYTLPKTVIVGGREYSIRSDYRAILDICEALTDPELSSEEKSAVVLYIFYPELGYAGGGLAGSCKAVRLVY